MDCRAGKASAPNRLLKARSKGLGDCLGASAGACWSRNGFGYGLQGFGSAHLPLGF